MNEHGRPLKETCLCHMSQSVKLEIMDNFVEKIEAYRSEENVSSPVWIFFDKTERKDESQCLICKKTVCTKLSNTMGM